MSNPQTAVIPGYVTEVEAAGVWALCENNEKLAVVGVNIGFGTFKPAEQNVCYIIVPVEVLPK